MEFLEYLISLPSLGAGLLLTVLNIARILIMHNKNNIQQPADSYVSDDNFEVLDQSETYVRTYETKIKVSGDKK